MKDAERENEKMKRSGAQLELCLKELTKSGSWEPTFNKSVCVCVCACVCVCVCVCVCACSF